MRGKQRQLQASYNWRSSSDSHTVQVGGVLCVLYRIALCCIMLYCFVLLKCCTVYAMRVCCVCVSFMCAVFMCRLCVCLCFSYVPCLCVFLYGMCRVCAPVCRFVPCVRVYTMCALHFLLCVVPCVYLCSPYALCRVCVYVCCKSVALYVCRGCVSVGPNLGWESSQIRRVLSRRRKGTA